MHLQFMNCCNSNIFPNLNQNCDSEFVADMPYPVNRLQGKEEMISNILPSFLLIGSKFLLMIDFDSNNEEQIMNWVEDKLSNAQTKGTSHGHTHRIRISERGRNFFKILVGGNEKLIVVLPLGLLNLHRQFFRTHTVEDYIFEDINDPKLLSKNSNSKNIINSLNLSNEEIANHLKNGIQTHQSEVTDYLEALWNN